MKTFWQPNPHCDAGIHAALHPPPRTDSPRS